MKVEEVFEKIGAHLRAGVKYHSEMMKIFEFMGFWGYAMEQRYHHYEEEQACIRFQHYFASHYFHMIGGEDEKIPEVVPSSWYKYSAQAVDIGTKRSAIKDLFGKWIEWEKNTKKLYEEMYQELTNLREVAAAIQVEKLIKDVDEELSQVQKQVLNLEAIGYDMTLIVDWQAALKKEYKKRIKKLF